MLDLEKFNIKDPEVLKQWNFASDYDETDEYIYHIGSTERSDGVMYWHEIKLKNQNKYGVLWQDIYQAEKYITLEEYQNEFKDFFEEKKNKLLERLKNEDLYIIPISPSIEY